MVVVQQMQMVRKVWQWEQVTVGGEDWKSKCLAWRKYDTSPVVGIRIQDKVCFFLNLVLEERDLSSYCTTAQCTVVLQIVLALQ